MAGSIGGNSFDRLEIQPQLSNERLETLMRPGVDGLAFRKTGKRGPPYSARSWKGLSKDTADSQLATYAASIGTSVTVTDTHGNTYTNVQILGVARVRVRQIGVAVGISGNAILECDWLLVAQA